MALPGGYYVKDSPRDPATHDQGSLNAASAPKTKSLKAKPSLFTLCEIPAVHDLTGANIRIEINHVVIKTHEYFISKFIYLNKLIEKARLINPQGDTLSISITGGYELVSDLLNTFKILSASSIEAPPSFDIETLISAARVAASYEYPGLRSFCIKRLEGLSLTSMERLKVARALDLKSWEERAYQELSEREETITKEEALTLDIDAYWKVANARERRYMEKPRSYTCEMLFFCAIVVYTLMMTALGHENPSM